MEKQNTHRIYKSFNTCLEDWIDLMVLESLVSLYTKSAIKKHQNVEVSLPCQCHHLSRFFSGKAVLPNIFSHFFTQ